MRRQRGHQAIGFTAQTFSVSNGRNDRCRETSLTCQDKGRRPLTPQASAPMRSGVNRRDSNALPTQPACSSQPDAVSVIENSKARGKWPFMPST